MRYTASIVDIRSIGGLLHLKTGIAYLGGGLWLVAEALQDVVRSWTGAGIRELIAVCGADSYAANCVRVNDAVLVAAGYPRVAAALRDRGCSPILLEMSEFRKMDGGLQLPVAALLRDYFGGICLLMPFSCWFSACCSDLVIWPPFWLAMSRSSCRT